MSATQMPLTSDELVPVEIDHPGFGVSARYKRGKAWTKKVTAIDPAKRGGWALEGDFLHEGKTHLPVGAILLHYSDWNAGSYGNPDYTARVLIECVAAGADTECMTRIEVPRSEWAAEAVEFLRTWAAARDTPEDAPPTQREVVAEAHRLLEAAIAASPNSPEPLLSAAAEVANALEALEDTEATPTRKGGEQG